MPPKKDKNSQLSRGRSTSKSKDPQTPSKKEESKRGHSQQSKSKSNKKVVSRKSVGKKSSKSESKSKSKGKRVKNLAQLKKDVDNLKKSKDKKKAKKDPTKPAKIRGAYIQFTTIRIPQLKLVPENAKKLEAKELKHTDFMGMAAAEWNKLSEKEKEKYVKLEAKDKVRYEKELAEWKEHGYYTMEDGTKSSKFAKDSGKESEPEEEKVVKKTKKPA